MNVNKRIVIIGGGPGGVCAAMLLASRGFSVTLLEKRAQVGGRSGSLQLGPYRFDLGSTMLMMSFVLEEMYEIAGRQLSDHMQLMQLSPMYRLDFGERHLDVFTDPKLMTKELKRFSDGAERGLVRFLDQEQRRLHRLYPVLQKDWPDLGSLANTNLLQALPHVGLGKSLYKTASDYFEDEALRLAFSFQSAYLGMSPWECPGGFAMVPFVEHAFGLFHVRGGIGTICESMAQTATELGATIRTQCPVDRLIVNEQRCEAVVTRDGEYLPADAVIIGADATRSLLQMLDRDISLRFSRHRIEQQRESCSTFMLYLGLDRPVPLEHHTFFFAKDYRAEMQRVFEEGTLGEDLSVYVCNPCVTDPSMAPPGHSALYGLALVPNQRANIDWRKQRSIVRNRMLHVVEHRLGCSLEPNIQVERSVTPDDWATEFEISHGAVFGPAHSIDQLLAFRLPNHLPSPDNVFLVGGGTNPGSGLPTILESARIAARLICDKYGVPFPAPKPLPTIDPQILLSA